MRKNLFRPAITMLLLLPATTFAAAVTYTYTGAPFTTVAGNVPSGASLSISITLASALLPSQTDEVVTPTSWTISDGFAADTLTNSNNTYSFEGFEFSTDAAGVITGWGIGAHTTGAVQAFSTTVGNWSLLGNQAATHDLFYETATAFSNNLSTPGTWTVSAAAIPVATPEPSTALLLALPLACLAFRARGAFRPSQSR